VRQFALADSLVDLTQYGFADLESQYTASTWDAVNLADGIYGLSQDSGPMIMLEPGYLAPIPTWSVDWWQALSNGTVASLIIGAWMPGILEGSVPDGAGDWRVAPVPSYDGTPVTAENGGSSRAVLKQSENPALAAAFLRWLNSSEQSIDGFLESGGFPSTTADLNSEEFLAEAPEYFGGQQINQVSVAASQNVVPDFQYLPFQVYANSVFPDTVGAAYTDQSDLNAGLRAWQEQLVSYGDSQGFKVN
jgi:multiple sugar transport system substrate-binding protein